MQATLRGFQRQQAARRKDEDQPSERSGYWFRDVSVPAPDNLPSDHDRVDEPLPDSVSRAGEFDLDAGRPVHSPAAVSRALDPEHPMQSSGIPDAAPPPVSIVEPSTGRRHPIPSADGDRPDRHLTGDAMMRFASRRLDPNQSVEAAWAQAVTEAAAEDAEATRP